jgi:hypothetical protein
MHEARIGDRASVERLYPRADFERDAGENARANATVHRGLLIVSPVDAEGRFAAERASRHVGEDDPEGDTVFLAPFLAEMSAPFQAGSAYGDAVETGAPAAAAARKADGYRAFIDRIIDAAKAADFKSPIGRHEARLRGFHGG